jgi:sec-independent protein translocase protein TatA
MPVPFALPSGQDLLLLVVVGFVLFVIFGKNLRGVGRSLGKEIIEFKKGMKGLEDDVNDGYSAPAVPQQQQPMQQPQALPEVPRPPQRITAAAPRFDEPANPQAPPKI